MPPTIPMNHYRRAPPSASPARPPGVAGGARPSPGAGANPPEKRRARRRKGADNVIVTDNVSILLESNTLQ